VVGGSGKSQAILKNERAVEYLPSGWGKKYIPLIANNATHFCLLLTSSSPVVKSWLVMLKLKF
jgi:hypothetical protein